MIILKTKKKPYTSAFSNAIWSFRGMLKNAPFSFILIALELPINVFMAWSGIYLPSLVIAEVTKQQSLQHAAFKVGTFIAFMLFAAILQLFFYNISQAFLTKYRFQKISELDKKSTGSLFFQVYEKKEIRDLYDRASFAIQMNNNKLPLCDMPQCSLKLIENVICYCLFGTVISFVSPWLILILTIAPIVNLLCARAYRQWEYNHRSNWTDIDSKLRYIQNKPSDFSASKDIRIYGMAHWFQQIYTDLSKERVLWEQKLSMRNFLSQIANLIVILLRDSFAYVMLIAMILKGEISIDQFVLYFAAISNFATYIGNIITEWNNIHTASLNVCDFREYMDLPEQDGTKEANIQEHLKTAPEITFDHVSFRYDGAKEDTLQDIHFTIHSGEKVALVGLNGAGKTTLVKLLCGLYLPTKGDIRINGISVRKFSRNDYYRLLSPVFQDVQTAFFSLAETVCSQIGTCEDSAKAEQCLRLAGLGKKLDSLPEGIHTKLDKQINENGIELSGGELQKLLLARALYKDAPILVLDEPTAALDPIAENEIYLQYHQMTKTKTSLFISHRLASTQFCDRILYLQNGKIAEEGTHAELISLGGEYSKLYEMQSCWYQKDYKGGIE